MRGVDCHSKIVRLKRTTHRSVVTSGGVVLVHFRFSFIFLRLVLLLAWLPACRSATKKTVNVKAVKSTGSEK